MISSQISFFTPIIIRVSEKFFNFENQNPDEREKQFIAEIISAIEKELPKFLNGCIAGIMHTYQHTDVEIIPQNTEENSDINFDFIGG